MSSTIVARPRIGWREWVSLPDLGIDRIKAKVDTGARTSALHASNIERFRRRGEDWVRFDVHPIQRDHHIVVHSVARLIDQRPVRNSGGRSEQRMVIRTMLAFLDRSWPIELTLTRRDQMGFRMLLGRQAIRGRFAVDPGHSFVGRKKLRAKKKKIGKKT